ncbi:sugar ABC transporter substrate-binding protein [Candidatus Sumerlaeota bacterium]|nr:sugar ABC transporter substrate-binding protein [Candidatus Sumerlaeota bacterium]
MTRLSRLLSLMLLALAFACQSAEDRDPNHVRLVWFGSEEEERAIREAVAEFEREYPGRRVTVQMVEWTRYTEKVMTMLMGLRPPDVARMSVQWCGRYQMVGALADLTPHLASVELDDFVPSRLASCRAGDQIFGLPHTSIGLMLYCNLDLFEEAGIEIPASPDEAWTWEEFSEVAQTLQRETGVRFGWGMYRGWFALLPFLYQGGGHLLDGDDPDFANPENIAALEWIIDQHRRGIAPQTSWSFGGDPAETLFIRGDCAMVITGNWRLVPYSQQITEFNWGVTYLPRGVRRAASTGGENIVVFDTPKVETATLLVAFLTSRDAMSDFCAETLFLPTRQSLLEGEVPYRMHREALERFIEQGRDFEPEWTREQSTPEFAAIDSVIVQQVELAILGHQTARESLVRINVEYRGAGFE